MNDWHLIEECAYFCLFPLVHISDSSPYACAIYKHWVMVILYAMTLAHNVMCGLQMDFRLTHWFWPCMSMPNTYCFKRKAHFQVTISSTTFLI